MIQKPSCIMFQRAGTANWWVRFSIKGERQIQKSLGTARSPLHGQTASSTRTCAGSIHHRRGEGKRSQLALR